VTACSLQCTSDGYHCAAAQTVVSCTCSCGKCCAGCLFCGVFQHGSFITFCSKCGAQASCALLTSSRVCFLLEAAKLLRPPCGTALALPLRLLLPFGALSALQTKTETKVLLTATTGCIYFHVAEYGGCHGMSRRLPAFHTINVSCPKTRRMRHRVEDTRKSVAYQERYFELYWDSAKWLQYGCRAFHSP